MKDELKILFHELNVCTLCLNRILNNSNKDKLPDLMEQNQITTELISSDKCDLCSLSLPNLSTILKPLSSKLDDHEFNNFSVGVKLNKSQKKQEEELLKRFPTLIPLKQTIANFITSFVSDQYGVLPENDDPEITILIEVKKRPRFNLQVKSLFYFGRYNKLVRGIPQTRWPCTICKGKKCDACNQTGLQYPQSVEMLIGAPVLKASEGQRTKFHGAGREDIDALMLGKGRPFVLEIKNPKIRNINIEDLVTQINQQPEVGISSLELSSKSKIRYLKESSSERNKSYRALINSDKIVNQEHIDKINQFGSLKQEIKQRTPHRVSHRRADKIRSKNLFHMKVISNTEKTFEIEITAQGGTYIKEFISGDGDRTNPSIAGLLDMSLECKELDVLMVDD